MNSKGSTLIDVIISVSIMCILGGVLMSSFIQSNRAMKEAQEKETMELLLWRVVERDVFQPKRPIEGTEIESHYLISITKAIPMDGVERLELENGLIKWKIKIEDQNNKNVFLEREVYKCEI